MTVAGPPTKTKRQENQRAMYILILQLPLLGATLAGAFGRKLGVQGAWAITTGFMLSTAIVVLIAFYEVAICGSPVTLILGTWVETVNLHIEWSLNFDSQTVSMLLPVVFISSLVHLYSSGYMEADPHQQRFSSYLSQFTFFMILQVTAENILQLFLGWEGVGLCSYLLINFWFTRIAANLAAQKAFLMNRVGDWAQNFAIQILLTLLGDLSLATLFSVAHFLNGDQVQMVTGFIQIGAIAKSGQIGLHTWLPSAMEGPTPVSALIHAATMVTAGVYLLLRFSPIFEWSSTSLLLVTWVGAQTALFGACSGQVEYDVKKVIAYSTTSQLGYMVMAAGLSQYTLSQFHLVNHAFFKALLFLSAGAIIHAVFDEQDFRKMGGQVRLLPRTYTAILLGSLSLVAFPFFTGFYSKDFIQEVALVPGSLTSNMAYLFTLFAALFTSFYSVRLQQLTFFSEPLFPRVISHSIADPGFVMFAPQVLLSVLSVVFASYAFDLFAGQGSGLFSHALFTHPNHQTLMDAEFLPSYQKFIPAIPLVLLLTVRTWNLRAVLSASPVFSGLGLMVLGYFAYSGGVGEMLMLLVPQARNSKRVSDFQLATFFSLFFIVLSLIHLEVLPWSLHPDISAIFFSDWSILFKTLSDLQALALTLYLAYSLPFILITLILLIVLIGAQILQFP